MAMIVFDVPGPRMARMAMASSTAGKAKSMSMIRIRTSSTHRP
jgi:hypothetical protein